MQPCAICATACVAQEHFCFFSNTSFPTSQSSVAAVFLTGSDRIPIHGMESLRIVIQSTTAEEHYLPVAHTCYNLLDMPRYQTKEILRRRLTQAVEQYEGFSLV